MLGREETLPQGEESINFELYWKCREIHLELIRAGKSIPFLIEFDSTNQPEPDDSNESRRLRKRPDFTCALVDAQATDYRQSQIRYTLECKRLGKAAGNWVFTENYSEHGMLRFRQPDHSYAKGARSGAMIGYVQNMTDDELLKEVSQSAAQRGIPSLSKAAAAWVARTVMQLDQNPMTRDFDVIPIQLNHLWLDLRHCAFNPPSSRQRVSDPSKEPKKKARKKALPRKVSQ